MSSLRAQLRALEAQYECQIADLTSLVNNLTEDCDTYRIRYEEEQRSRIAIEQKLVVLETKLRDVPEGQTYDPSDVLSVLFPVAVSIPQQPSNLTPTAVPPLAIPTAPPQSPTSLRPQTVSTQLPETQASQSVVRVPIGAQGPPSPTSPPVRTAYPASASQPLVPPNFDPQFPRVVPPAIDGRGPSYSPAPPHRRWSPSAAPAPPPDMRSTHSPSYGKLRGTPTPSTNDGARLQVGAVPFLHEPATGPSPPRGWGGGSAGDPRFVVGDFQSKTKTTDVVNGYIGVSAAGVRTDQTDVRVTTEIHVHQHAVGGAHSMSPNQATNVDMGRDTSHNTTHNRDISESPTPLLGGGAGGGLVYGAQSRGLAQLPGGVSERATPEPSHEDPYDRGAPLHGTHQHAPLRDPNLVLSLVANAFGGQLGVMKASGHTKQPRV